MAFRLALLSIAGAVCEALTLTRAGEADVKTGPELVSSTGSAAALNEDGYKLVASLKNDEEMEAFVRRLLASDGRKVRDGASGELSGFVPFFSGIRATQNLAALRHELEQASWVTRASNVDVEMALDTLRHERVSGYTNASAYALAIANALSTDNGAKSQVIVEDDLDRMPLTQLAALLREESQQGAKVVWQRNDGRVTVADPQTVSFEVAALPLQRWATRMLDTKNKIHMSAMMPHQGPRRPAVAKPTAAKAAADGASANDAEPL